MSAAKAAGSSALKTDLGASLSTTEDTKDRIEKMFYLIEEKTRNLNSHKPRKAGSVTNSVKSSVFGIFADSYRKYKEQPGKRDSIRIWRDFFVESKILNDVQRCLLYFNLPQDVLLEECRPRLLY